MITSHQDLRDLYEQHCTCRPIDVLRADDAHGPNCNLVVLADVRAALGGNYAAVKRCDLYQRGDYMACKEVIQ